MDNPLLALAGIAVRWRDCPIPPEVEWSTRRAILDWFAAMLPGCAEGPALNLARVLTLGRGSGMAITYVDGGHSDARHAALLNGIASHSVEFDDIFRDGGYHPGSPTIAAALAVAQQQAVSADAFRRSVIAGYEIGCRIALALQPSHYRNWHITATIGTIGAAVSTALLRGCDRDQIAHAIAIASSFAGGHQENLQGKGLAKALHCGHAAEAGVLAGLAAAAGITGSLDSLHAPHGYAAATSDGTGNWRAAFEGAGEWTPISRMTVKNYGCCGHIFPTLDAIRVLQGLHKFVPEDVRSIEIFGYGATVSMCDRLDVETARDARFSMQYCVAALLYLGNVRLAAFEPAALARSDIRGFMAKVSVAEDAEIAAAYPGRRMARIRLTLADGRSFEHFQRTRKGDPDDPLSDAELFDKYDELAATVLTPLVSDQLKTLIMHQDRLPGPIALRDRTEQPVEGTVF